jgi:hypothetical protein
MRRIAEGSSIRLLLAGFAATAFAGVTPVKNDSERDRTTTPPAFQSPAPKQGLNFVVGAHGLDSLRYNGQPLFSSAESGELQPWKSTLRAALDLLFPPAGSSISSPTKRPDSVDLVYPWGRVSCAYGKQGDKITMRIDAFNTSSKPINEFSVRLMELSFPRVPDGGTLEAGMFAFGFRPGSGFDSFGCGSAVCCADCPDGLRNGIPQFLQR